MFKRTEKIFLWNVDDKRKGVNFEIQCNKVFFWKVSHLECYTLYIFDWMR